MISYSQISILLILGMLSLVKGLPFDFNGDLPAHNGQAPAYCAVPSSVPWFATGWPHRFTYQRPQSMTILVNNAKTHEPENYDLLEAHFRGHDNEPHREVTIKYHPNIHLFLVNYNWAASNIHARLPRTYLIVTWVDYFSQNPVDRKVIALPASSGSSTEVDCRAFIAPHPDHLHFEIEVFVEPL